MKSNKNNLITAKKAGLYCAATMGIVLATPILADDEVAPIIASDIETQTLTEVSQESNAESKVTETSNEIQSTSLKESGPKSEPEIKMVNEQIDSETKSENQVMQIYNVEDVPNVTKTKSVTDSESVQNTEMMDKAFAQTDAGTLFGYEEDGVYTFKGVPYATAERFEEPVPVTRYENGEFLALYDGPVSPQDRTLADTGSINGGEFVNPGSSDMVGNENCQNLNVWTQSLDQNANKAVLVFFHGGGLDSGSQNELGFYNGKYLTKSEDLVFVSVNHRLNILGFTDLSEFGTEYRNSGIAGLKDCVEALKWVQKNIRNFGGNPDNVTVIGQSGGGCKVEMLASMPETEGLFSKVVDLSPMVNPGTHDNAVKSTESVMKGMGLDPQKPADRQEFVNRLKSMSYEELKKTGLRTNANYWSEGDLKEPLFVNGSLNESAAKRIWLRGFTISEFSGNNNGAVMPSHRDTYENQALQNDLSKITNEEALQRLWTRYGNQTEAIIKAFRKAYPTHSFKELLFLNTWTRAGEILGDQANLNRYNNSGATVYNYVSAYTYPYFGGMTMGHTNDMAFWFNSLEALKEQVAGDEANAQKVATTMSHALAQFAKTGNPSSDSLKWDPYTKNSHQVMILDVDSKQIEDADLELYTLIQSARGGQGKMPDSLLKAFDESWNGSRQLSGNAKDVMTKEIVNIDAGKLVGYKHDGVYNFKGVEYANAKRFEDPVYKDKYEDGWALALTYGTVSPQTRTLADSAKPNVGEFINPGKRDMVGNENCQNLNVWTQSLDKNAKKAVIVFFHGGGLADGSAHELGFYNGQHLAKSEDVVFVSVNHRLNVLGFLNMSAYGEQYRNSGLAGIKDCVMALRWVQNNIAQFGGDPNNVTIVGQSGGGFKVEALACLKETEGLFNRVVNMSGGGSPITNEKAQENTAKVVEHVAKENNVSLEEAVAMMLTMPYEKLLAACQAVGVSGNMSYGGNSDYTGPLFDEDGKMNESAAKRDWMYGLAYSEFSGNNNSIMRENDFAKQDEENNLSKITDEQAMTRLQIKYGDRTDKIVEAFRKAYPNHKLAELLYINAGRQNAILGDQAKLNLFNKNGKNVYNYLAAYTSPYFGGMTMGHTNDMQFWFNALDEVRQQVRGDEQNAYRVAATMARALANFARTGDPSDQARSVFSDPIHWQPYSAEAHHTMVFDAPYQNLGTANDRIDFDRELMEWIAGVRKLEQETQKPQEEEKKEPDTRPIHTIVTPEQEYEVSILMPMTSAQEQTQSDRVSPNTGVDVAKANSSLIKTLWTYGIAGSIALIRRRKKRSAQ